MKTAIAILLLFIFNSGLAQQRPVPDITLTNYEYPFEVHFLDLKSQNQHLNMAYMDVKPQSNNGKTIMLLHGKNFNGA